MTTTIETCELVDWAVRLVAVQTDVSRDDALTVLREIANATDATVDEVAELVVMSRISLAHVSRP
jgi:hypothetical protein